MGMSSGLSWSTRSCAGLSADGTSAHAVPWPAATAAYTGGSAPCTAFRRSSISARAIENENRPSGPDTAHSEGVPNTSPEIEWNFGSRTIHAPWTGWPAGSRTRPRISTIGPGLVAWGGITTCGRDRGPAGAAVSGPVAGGETCSLAIVANRLRLRPMPRKTSAPARIAWRKLANITARRTLPTSVLTEVGACHGHPLA